ncbi:uncharacterized protein TRIADDRAFT_30877 [Trichoplax adhaerens]|uniref:AP-3 complex subunit beta n=1 Tax=Trichoplax adhaerens TaxID=10228 RepID=B3S805_TRIAD|nr:hypothetical protein TRIADDRAFT_30877 [Trichoplax adhaerens]EDV21108.1 hypothetical protein TRIADDRAFT_30877 [Trichoplax adhaerens]|eukprot:XP_002116438.1 hypothetical protein TRIADDRAFT_30877 [Trichoplax adhaerens]
MSDPASGGIFSTDFKRHEDLKQMLDSNKDNLKLDAMKRIVTMMSRGRNVSSLFPAVVKNVVSKNNEIKKLVFVYLVRYAEEQQDLALLSVSTFQKSLKESNQLIRASALRVLCSIRVPVIVPIMLLSIKEAAADLSPFVRKTAANAIVKIYSLDPELKDALVEIIEKLLKDKTTLVAGSAVMAFEEVCPERIDLIHKNYRKLCNLVMDIDEWGQVTVINMLTKYARSQFLDPNQNETEGEEPFYPDDDDEEEAKDESENGEANEPKKKPYFMDADHRLLLRTTRPLLQSRNAAVVMAVAQLYYYLAPRLEMVSIIKPLVRLQRSHKEVQIISLTMMATMSVNSKGLFEPYLKSFYVRSTDPIQVKLLKLEILTNIATESTIPAVLKEFQTYVTGNDREFAVATVQAIGRCASSIKEVSDSCLSGLVSLLSNKDEKIVGESVVIIKKLLQQNPSEHTEIIKHMAKIIDRITFPMARASIMWLMGEYCDKVPKIAPDVLRIACRGFMTEENIVKLQIINLASKLNLTNHKQTKLLCQYIFNLAKYDLNYDIRDRVRFLRPIIMPSEKGGALHKYAKKIFFTTKPAPVLKSAFIGRDRYILGSLSHILDQEVSGYSDLPSFPEEAPDPTVRNVEVPKITSKSKKKMTSMLESFYSESEEESNEDEGKSSEEESNDDSEEDSDESSEDDDSESEESDSDSDEESDEDDSSEEESSSSSESSSEESEESEESSSSVEEEKPKAKKVNTPPPANNAPSYAPIIDSNILAPVDYAAAEVISKPERSTTMPSFVPSSLPRQSFDLLTSAGGQGLAAVYRFTRSPSLHGSNFVSVEITFTNHSQRAIRNIGIKDKKLQADMIIREFSEISSLESNASKTVLIGIDFKDTTHAAKFSISTQEFKCPVNIKAVVGELVKPSKISPESFKKEQGKLAGMYEVSDNFNISSSLSAQTICSRVVKVLSCSVINIEEKENSLKCYFAAQTISGNHYLLVTLHLRNSTNCSVTVNCEKIVFNSMLTKDLKTELTTN